MSDALPMPERAELVMQLECCKIAQICECYGINPATLYKWMRALNIPKKNVGRPPSKRSIP